MNSSDTHWHTTSHRIFTESSAQQNSRITIGDHHWSSHLGDCFHSSGAKVRWQLDTVQRQKSPNKWHKSAHAGELDQPLQVLSKSIHLMTVDIDMYLAGEVCLSSLEQKPWAGCSSFCTAVLQWHMSRAAGVFRLPRGEFLELVQVISQEWHLQLQILALSDTENQLFHFASRQRPKQLAPFFSSPKPQQPHNMSIHRIPNEGPLSKLRNL